MKLNVILMSLILLISCVVFTDISNMKAEAAFKSNRLAGRVNLSTGSVGWPVGTGLQKFEERLASSAWPSPENLEFSGGYWYEKKLFFIETESDSYSGAIITEVIAISNNVLIVFYHNGFVMYLPFNRIVKMYEVK